MGKREKTEGTTRPRLKPKFSKIVVVAVLFSVAAFTVTMILLFLRTGSIPDSLVAPFFAFAGGEAGVLGLIRYADSKYPENGATDSTDGGVG